MKKIIMLTLLILSVFSGYAESGTFNISQYNNTNDLIRDKQFQKHIKHFFGSLTGYYFWKGGVAQQVTDGLWGTPDSVVRPDKNIWMASACRPHSCTEKAAYITNGRYELFALIGYMCPSENGGIQYKYDGCFSIFYHERNAEKALSPYLIRWKEKIIPGAPVYPVRVYTHRH
ncbi:hypothetical protein EAN25_10070 [Salmonella enterica]|nr:hypothetical protein [Salmonella enterica]